MNDTFLQVRDLSVIYKTDLETVYAVNGISFDLQKGETLGLVGETGAGKTTTALSILRLLPERTAKITAGEIDFEGQQIIKVNEMEKTDENQSDQLTEKQMQKIRGENISMIFQDPMTALNPVLTVGDQIAESLILHNDEGRSRDEIDKRVDESLEMVGIPASRKKEYPHQFSGGMKQRVIIAMALACNPSLLIADEPTTALDVTIQAQVLAMMRDLKDKLGTSMIMITHDLGVVAETCDKVGVMYAGEIIEYGTVEDIFTGDKHHPYTVGLFGSIPNLDSDEPRLHPIEGMMPDPTNLPQGCSFSPRCPHCMDKCKEMSPADFVEGSHRIRCRLFDKEEEAK